MSERESELKSFLRFVIYPLLSGFILLSTPQSASSQTTTAEDDIPRVAAMNRLGVKLTPGATNSLAVRKAIDTLAREQCDETAIFELGDALEKVGFRRDAANAYVGFSTHCRGHSPSMRRAINILLIIRDFDTAVERSSDLIALEPFGDNGYYLRALSNDRAGRHEAAIGDYITAIELFGNKEQISSVGYFALARSYERLGQFCDAMGPIETWVGINPGRNDTSQTRAILADYASKGRCESVSLNAPVTIPIARKNNVITTSLLVNGVRGVFMLDTGATFVSMKKSFAEKAKVNFDKNATVKLSTANGITEASRGRADKVALKTIEAKNVAVVVQADNKGTYGDGVDGLLGMSFLSRFKVTFDTKVVRIEPRRTVVR
jgi:clan AA aspartic protease (TIGR02281 family)